MCDAKSQPLERPLHRLSFVLRGAAKTWREFIKVKRHASLWLRMRKRKTSKIRQTECLVGVNMLEIAWSTVFYRKKLFSSIKLACLAPFVTFRGIGAVDIRCMIVANITEPESPTINESSHR